MKTIILILIVNLSIYGQLKKTPITTIPSYFKDVYIIGTEDFATSMTFIFEAENKSFTITSIGDTLVTSGNLAPDKGALIFLKYVKYFHSKRIDSLTNELAKCKIK